MALVTDIADAVAAEINSAPPGTFSETVAAQRMVLPEFELSDLADLKVTVVPRSMEITGSTRTLAQHDMRIDIGIQKRIGKNIDTDVIALLGLVDEIADFLKRRPLAAATWAIWVKTDNEPIYAPDHLAEQRTFTSVLTLTYRVLK